MTIDDLCKQGNQTDSQGNVEVLKGWGGIPEAILMDAVIALFLVIMLIIFRGLYYRRKPFVKEWNSSFIEFIFGDRDVNILHDRTQINRRHPVAYLAPSLREYARQVKNHYPAPTDDFDAQNLFKENRLKNERKIFHQRKLDTVGQSRWWLWDYLLISDQDIFEHRGNDAFQYLLFQRYIIYLLFAMFLLCIGIILPINIYGKVDDYSYFDSTTINNIDEGSNIFWVHTIIAIIIVIWGFFLMKNFSDLIFSPTEDFDDRTLAIKHIPLEKRDVSQLKTYLEKIFPKVNVIGVTFAWNVKELKRLKTQLMAIESALNYLDHLQRKQGPGPSVKLCVCALNSCCGMSTCGVLDAAEFYRGERLRYKQLIIQEVEALVNKPEDVIFVRLQTRSMAERIFNYFEETEFERYLQVSSTYWRGILCSGHKRAQTDLDLFNTLNWKVTMSPMPEDIEWDTIISNPRLMGVVTLLLNLFVAVIFIFLTTPLVLTEFIEDLVGTETINVAGYKFAFTRYVSPLMMNLFSAILPNLLTLIVLNEPQTAKSESEAKVVHVVYIFLLFMVVIFPSLGLSTGQLIFKRLFDNASPIPDNFYKCLFPAGKSTFFVHYVISCLFINNAFQLLRLPELAMYLIYYCFYSSSAADNLKAKLKIDFQFSYGSEYPRFLLVFTIVATNCIGCPLIVPFGLLFMVLKHLVDRYCIYYLYHTPIISPQIHRLSIQFVLVSFLFLFIQLATFLNSRFGHSFHFTPSNVLVVALFFYTFLLIFLARNFGKYFGAKKVRARLRNRTNSFRDEEETVEPTSRKEEDDGGENIKNKGSQIKLIQSVQSL